MDRPYWEKKRENKFPLNPKLLTKDHQIYFLIRAKHL